MNTGTDRTGPGDVAIVELPPGDARWAVALPVLRELRSHLTAELLTAVLAGAGEQGLRFAGAFDGDGSCLGVAGWRVVDNTSSIRKLYVDDLVTTAAARSRGIGAPLLADLRGRGRAAGCRLLELDSGVARFAAHRFYLRERFDITAHHFGTTL